MCLRVPGLDRKKIVLTIHDHEPSCMKVLDLHYHHLHDSRNFKKLTTTKNGSCAADPPRVSDRSKCSVN